MFKRIAVTLTLALGLAVGGALPAEAHTISGCYNFTQGTFYETENYYISPVMTIPSLTSGCRDVNVTHVTDGNWAPINVQVRGVVWPAGGGQSYHGSWFWSGSYHNWEEVIWDIPNGWQFQVEFHLALNESGPVHFAGAI